MNHIDNLLFRQLFDEETYTYTYLLADQVQKEGILIDSVHEQVNRDLKLINELEIDIKYILDTHVHADHITGAFELKNKLNAQYVVGAGSNLECADILIKHGQTLNFGSFQLEGLSTPGHTDSCTTYYIENMIFTGDTLLIRGCGRTDFQQGSSEKLFDSIRNTLFNLPPDTIIYPGHDYKGLTSSSIKEEQRWNPRVALTKTQSDFLKIMDELDLADPKHIKTSIPANMQCGKLDKSHSQTNPG